MRLVNGRYVEEDAEARVVPDQLSSGGPEVRLVGNRWLVVALALAVVALAALGGFIYVDHRSTTQEPAAVRLVRAFYAALDDHDANAVVALMAPNGSHLGNGALGGDFVTVGAPQMKGFLYQLFSSGDFSATLTGPASVVGSGPVTWVMAPNRLSASLPGGQRVNVTGVSSLSLVDVGGQLKIERHSWQEQGSLGWSRWAEAGVAPVFACPATATADQPGPAAQARPTFEQPWGVQSKPMAVDSRTGQVVAVSAGRTWTFNVCTNTWGLMPPTPSMPGSFAVWLVYDAYDDVTLAFSLGEVWAYTAATNTWTPRPVPDGLFLRRGSAAVYDPVSGQVLLYNSDTGDLWAYQAPTNTATHIDADSAARPPTGSYNALIAYDSIANRLVLTVAGQTWLFDPGTRQWARQHATPPSIQGEPSMVTFDTAAGRTVVFNGLVMATYTAADNTWTTVQPGPGWPLTTADGATHSSLTRYGAALVYDPVNQRDLLVGGMTDTGPADDVWAYSLATNTWTQLVPPAASEPG